MMRNKISLFIGAILFGLFFTQCKSEDQPQVVDLWQDGIPIDNELTEPEELLGNGYLATNISVPQLYIYKPKGKSNGKAVVICPGGGYAALAIGHEGNAFARWLSSIGITGIVLKYRLPNKHKEIPMLDVQQAMRYVRGNAIELGIDPNKIGIAGFSAGGHIASIATTHFATEGISTRPDFSIFYYPVITMKEYTHEYTRLQLLGDSLVSEDLDYFSNEEHVTADTPPAILFLSDDDDQVDPMNSSLYYNALRKNNVSASMHVFPKGRHGWGMSPEHMEFRYYNEMLGLLEKWLADLKLEQEL